MAAEGKERPLSRRRELLALLADGREHSGEELATRLAVTRAAVWKQLRQLQDWGLEVVARPRRGYRLAQPLELLDPAAVRAALPGLAAERLRELVVEDELDSTNDRLLAVADLPAGRFDACLAEFQRAGRGRRGRHWVAPYGCGLCLSLNWSWSDAPAGLGALSLAAGVAVLRTLAAAGLRDAALKWPNDLLHQDRKLGGILIEMQTEAAGAAYAVIGVGLNVALPATALAALRVEGVAATDLASTLGKAPPRSALAGALIGQLALALEEFGARGLAPFAAEWQRADALAGRPVRVSLDGEPVDGVARGIDEDGALLVETPAGRRRFVSGEVSVRLER